MFTRFFYLLRHRGLDISINEWLLLVEALEKGLAKSSLVQFYYLARAILIKSEADFDKFDEVFQEYFKNIKEIEDLPDEFWKWLNKGTEETDKQEFWGADNIYDIDELLELFEERKKEQNSEHNGGARWIGTGARSRFGNSGFNPAGIRAGGASIHRSALQIAGARNFRDFRQDKIIDIRDFQVAFKKLRQYSNKIDVPKTEFNVDESIKETSENAGYLKIVWDRPKKNTVKVLLLIDSDGSMRMHMNLINRLFQAVNKTNHFRDLKIYYFHNCIYDYLYTDPLCLKGHWVKTEWVLNNLSSEYKLIIIGDASMAPSELMVRGGNSYVGIYNDRPGIDWLVRLNNHYKHNVWYNPKPKERWDSAYGRATLGKIREIFPMYDLSLGGLEQGIKKLLVRK